MSSTSADESWKTQPPYHIQSPESFGTVHWTASCQCGRVTYKINREKPLDAKYCHCRTCQVLHGAPFQWAAIFPKSRITFDNGAANLAFYDSGNKTRERRLPCKVSCAHCRSPIMDEGRNMALIFPGLVDLRGEEGRRVFMPSCHIFYSQRVVEIPDGKTKWVGMDNSSDMMQED